MQSKIGYSPRTLKDLDEIWDYIEFELCIYQNDEVVVFNPTAEDILPIMDKIVHLDKILAECDAEEA